jgi:predicted ATPase
VAGEVRYYDGINNPTFDSTAQLMPTDQSSSSSYSHFDEGGDIRVDRGHAVDIPKHLLVGSIKLTDWIASQRNQLCERKHYLEQVVQILYSLVYQILHGYNIDGSYTSILSGGHDDDSDDDEKIFVHPNFITIDNVIVHEQTQAITAVDGTAKLSAISASFVEFGDSIFVTEGGDDEGDNLRTNMALYALGSMASTICLMENGASTYQLNFTNNANSTSETKVSAALSLSEKDNPMDDDHDDVDDDDCEAEISDLIRKNFRTNTSEEKDCGGVKTALLDAGIPFPFCRLVLDLLDNGHGLLFRSEYSFSSFKDVQSDLRQMLVNPEGFLHGSNPDRWKLTFGEKLYGRNADMKALNDAADRVANRRVDPMFDGLARLTGNKTEVVMVSGSPGSGKSHLVRLGWKGLEKRGWRFVQCKFDRVVQAEPLSIISHAFDDFLGHYVCNHKQGMEICDYGYGGGGGGGIAAGAGADADGASVYQKVHARLSRFIHREGLEILATYIPSLQNMMHIALPLVPTDVNTTIMTELFSTLLKAISSDKAPILFFIDDLQWADPLSLDLLLAIVKGARSDGFHLSAASTNNRNKSETIAREDPYVLFVGTYRENTVGDYPTLDKFLNKLQDDDSINMTDILLSGMTVKTLNGMLTDCLCMPKRRVKSLSELVIQKTDGLPLYVIEFLRALETDKLLCHSLTRGWEWDEVSIDIFPITESVAELFTFKLHRLSRDVLLGLQITSIFGTQVEQQIINLVKNYDGRNSVDISAALHVAQSEGLIERAANLINFSHDLIQKATIDSICEADLVPLLRKLISALVKEASAANLLDSMLFVAVDLINRIGNTATNCPHERACFAELNWHAGTKALAVPDFAGAAMYAESGIALLSNSCWETQYDLSLRLYETAVMSHFSKSADGQDHLMNRIRTVFERALNFSDKFNTHRIWIQVLATTDLPGAIDQCLVALEQLGEPLDLSNIDYINACEELLNLQVRYSGASDTLLSKPGTESTKKMAMAIMSTLILLYNQIKSFLGAVVSCRMIDISMNYGYCADSIYGTAAYAVSLVTCLGDIDGGYSWGRKAMALLKLCGTPSLIPKISASLYGFVFVWKEPFQSTLEFLADGIRSSFVYGYVEYAKVFTQMYISRSFHVGKNIRLLAEEVDALARQHAIRCGDSTSSDAFNRLIFLPMSIIFRDIQGDTAHSVMEMDRSKRVHHVYNDDLLKVAIEGGNSSLLYTIISLQTAKEFMLRNMDEALKLTDIYFEHFGSKKLQMTYIYIFHDFYDGLINFHFAGRTGDARYRERAENALMQLREWSRHSDWNFQSKLFLLKAEKYRIENDVTNAATYYDASIKAAHEHKFIHEEAMANELAGIFYWELGSHQRALVYFKQSIVCYKKWGASAIAREIESRIEKHYSMNNAGQIMDAEQDPRIAPKLCERTTTKRQY